MVNVHRLYLWNTQVNFIDVYPTTHTTNVMEIQEGITSIARVNFIDVYPTKQSTNVMEIQEGNNSTYTDILEN